MLHVVQWNLSTPRCIGREIWCRNRQGVGLHSVKHIDKWSNKNENQCRITQWNGLHRCQIRQFLLYQHKMFYPLKKRIYTCKMCYFWLPIQSNAHEIKYTVDRSSRTNPKINSNPVSWASLLSKIRSLHTSKGENN